MSSKAGLSWVHIIEVNTELLPDEKLSITDQDN
jgi:hypothetical protein